MVTATNPILEKYGLDKLSENEKREVFDALLVSLASKYPNEEWPQWLCDLIDERLAEPYDPSKCMTLEEFSRETRGHPLKTTRLNP